MFANLVALLLAHILLDLVYRVEPIRSYED